MGKNTKHRIAVACLGTLLSAPAAFVGGGLTAWEIMLNESGLETPEMFGWMGWFLVCGWTAFVIATPSLLVMMLCAIVRNPPLGRHALLSVILPFVLGGVAWAVYFSTDPKLTWPGFFAAMATCVAVVGIAEAVMGKTVQNHASDGA
jgi:hypothetical protein